MTDEEREQQWSPLTSESGGSESASGDDDDISPPHTPLSNPSLTNEEMQQYASGHAMAIFGPSIDVSESPTYCTLDSDGNFVDEDSSEEEEETLPISTPRSIRAARRSAWPIALMFLLTMAVPGDETLVLQPALCGSELTGAEWSQLARDVHADFYYYRNVGRVALAAPLLLLFAAVAVAAMRLWEYCNRNDGTIIAFMAGTCAKCGGVGHQHAKCPTVDRGFEIEMAQRKRKKYGLKNFPHYLRKKYHIGADGMPMRKIYGPAIWSKGMELCSNVINGVRCNQEHLRRLCPSELAGPCTVVNPLGEFCGGPHGHADCPFLPTSTPPSLCPVPGPAPVSCKPPLDHDPNFDLEDAIYKIYEASDLKARESAECTGCPDCMADEPYTTGFIRPWMPMFMSPILALPTIP
jgi:hypothetical protein